MADTYLNVVDGDDVVIGRQLRSIIHRDGLRHREVHVWFVTPKHELILQRRGATKDTNPNMLTSTVGGHVEEGQDYMQAALTECLEETGIEVMRAFVTPLAKVDLRDVDPVTNTVNCVYRMVYLHKFKGEFADLKAETGDGAGFVTISVADMLAKRGPLMAQMAPALLSNAYAPVWTSMKDVLHL